MWSSVTVKATLKYILINFLACQVTLWHTCRRYVGILHGRRSLLRAALCRVYLQCVTATTRTTAVAARVQCGMFQSMLCTFLLSPCDCISTSMHSAGVTLTTFWTVICWIHSVSIFIFSGLCGTSVCPVLSQRPPLYPVLSQMNLFHRFTHCFNFIFRPSIPRSPSSIFPSDFLLKNFCALFFHAC